MKPADIKRQHNSIREERRRNTEEANRLVHEAQRLAVAARKLEDDRRAWELERERALTVLRMLCTRFGTSDWDTQTPLDEILTDHLADPLEEMVSRVNRRLRRAVEATPATPALQPVPRAVGLGDHHTTVMRSAEGSVAACRCGWASEATWTDGEALMAARAHVRAPEQGRRHA